MELKTIMLVDDEPDILTVAELALTKVGGFDVVSYTSSKKALEDVTHLLPDLIILDMMMPNMNGIQTLQKIKTIKAAENIPVIFMTAKVQNNEIDDYIASGAIGVIRKPFDPMTFPEKVRQLYEGCGDYYV